MSVPAVVHPAGGLALHPREDAASRRCSPSSRRSGKASKNPLKESFANPVNLQLRAAGAVRRHGRAGRRLVHRPVLRADVPAERAQDRLEDGVHRGVHRAGPGDAAVPRVRLAVGSDRPQEDHAGRLRAGGADLRADLHGDEALRQPEACPRPIPAQVNHVALVLLLTMQMVYVCMVYGPIAAFLVELFPTKIRYTSMSLPYHLGNGWFGGFLPLIATAVTASAWAKGPSAPNAIYTGLVYPIADLPDHPGRRRPATSARPRTTRSTPRSPAASGGDAIRLSERSVRLAAFERPQHGLDVDERSSVQRFDAAHLHPQP